ncbi:phosphotransferase [Paenibacillus silvae]|uniref:phosphotransferase n=1 Tax=Paenibacillus silvae TaxID=1325358 RepID=UPI0025A0D8CB|nr:phosphotransferase [Paenibacillus silvae]MDM5276308.1 phosphotransferase [Paenibacillus silvae]
MKSDLHFSHNELQEYVHSVFGYNYHAAEQTRMQGGAQKVIYKINFTNGFTCLLYIWDISSNYFQDELLEESTFQNSYGSSLFSMNTVFLRNHGIRTPALYDMRNGRNGFEFDFALVEYIEGQPAESYFQHPNIPDKHALFQEIGSMISTMHAIGREQYGKADDDKMKEIPCFKLKQDDAINALCYASKHIAMIKENHDHLLHKLAQLESQIRLRSHHHLIHDELGPNHIIIDHKMQPYLIDIEGAGFFDLEHEHSFLKLRFGEYYRYFEQENLDSARLSFYRLCHHLSLTSGGLKLLHRQFPDRQFARKLAAYHARQAIEMLSHNRD